MRGNVPSPTGLGTLKWATIGQRRSIAGILFLLPSLVVFAVFQLYPMLHGLSLSLYRYDLLSPKRFIGLANFREILGDPLFWESTWVTLVYVIGTYAPVFLLSLGLALLLRSATRGQMVFRTVFYMPNIVSIVAIAVVWKLIFHPSGLSAEVTRYFTSEPIAWLNRSGSSQVAIIVTNVWREVGYFTILFLAGLLGIPQEYYEAAAVDGANGFQMLRGITLPLLTRTMLFAVILSAVRGVQTFVPQFVMTRGGPGMANTPLTLHLYNTAFVYYKMGKASAMAVLLGTAIMAFTVLQLRIFSDEGKA